MTTTSCLILLLNLSVLFAFTHQRIIHLLPDDQPLSQCPVEEGCYRLSLLLVSSDQLSGNIISNVTLALLPGTHTVTSTVNEVISIDSATNFTLRAANSSTGASVNCNGTIGFEFSRIKNLFIDGISFKNCGASKTLSRGSQIHFTLYIFNSQGVAVTKLNVKNGRGYGLLAVSVFGDFLLSNSTLIGSRVSFGLFAREVSHQAREQTDHNITIKNSQFTKSDQKCCSMSPTPHIELNIGKALFLSISDVDFDDSVTSVIMKFVSCTSTVKLQRGGIVVTPRSSDHQCSTNRIVVNGSQFMNSVLTINNGTAKNIHVLLVNVSFTNTALVIPYTGPIVLRDTKFQNNRFSGLFPNGKITIQGNFVYRGNKEGITLLHDLLIDRSAHLYIADNNCLMNGKSPLHAIHSQITVLDNSTIVFQNNTGMESGGMFLIQSDVIIKGKVNLTFSRNKGSRGGALAMYEKSQMKFDSNAACAIDFIGNHASIVGGAIFVQDSEYYSYDGKYFEFYTANGCQLGQRVNFSFSSNTAVQAGSAMYGGRFNHSEHDTVCVSFNFNIAEFKHDLSPVSSDPARICMCNNSEPDCSLTKMTVEVIPGQMYEIEAVAVGQMFGVVPTVVRANFMGEKSVELEPTEYLQSVGRNCSRLKYTIRSSNSAVILGLSTGDKTATLHDQVLLPSEDVYKQLLITFLLKDCALGFTFDRSLMECVCQETVVDHGIDCNSKVAKVNRISQKWIGVTYSHLLENHKTGVIIHDHCPFDYCKLADGTQSLDLLYPDEQCAFNRSGILCGACQTNFSHVLGTSRCKQCTDSWIALIIPLFAIAGLVLVLGMMFLNLTVSMGTINGLIFYANIVRANHIVFFPCRLSNSVFSTFIAWLNLDLGIEICFYNGLDAYVKTWFQFLFPLYIWFIVMAIIVASHYSTRASKLCGSTAVKVLATIFLLSYAKLLQTIMTVFSSTELVYPNGHHRRVWLYDGNVDYLKGKHNLLFISSLFLLMFILVPYTVLLLCIQLLQRFSDRDLWPLFNAYTRPYKKRHYYWTGLLLLVRVCLYLVFSLNTLGTPMINLLAITVTMFCILAYFSIIGGVYKLWWLNIIEVINILNLGILSLVSLYQIRTGVTTNSITYISTGIAFVMFTVIVFYHSVLKFVKQNNK